MESAIVAASLWAGMNAQIRLWARGGVPVVLVMRNPPLPPAAQLRVSRDMLTWTAQTPRSGVPTRRNR